MLKALVWKFFIKNCRWLEYWHSPWLRILGRPSEPHLLSTFLRASYLEALPIQQVYFACDVNPEAILQTHIASPTKCVKKALMQNAGALISAAFRNPSE